MEVNICFDRRVVSFRVEIVVKIEDNNRCESSEDYFCEKRGGWIDIEGTIIKRALKLHLVKKNSSTRVKGASPHLPRTEYSFFIWVFAGQSGHIVITNESQSAGADKSRATESSGTLGPWLFSCPGCQSSLLRTLGFVFYSFCRIALENTNFNIFSARHGVSCSYRIRLITFLINHKCSLWKKVTSFLKDHWTRT